MTALRPPVRVADSMIAVEATTKAVDSLLNYETVKYFSNEVHEATRFDGALRGYERAAVNNQLSLSLLNIGQGIIIAAGLVLLLSLSVPQVLAGEMTVGDFVAIQAYLIQLYLPLNFLGFAYREIRQGLVDMEYMFNLLDVVVNLYMWCFIISAILSWLIAFNVINTSNRFIYTVGDFLYRITEPVLRPIRNMLPNFGNIDFSPLIAILLLIFLKDGVLRQVYIWIAA